MKAEHPNTPWTSGEPPRDGKLYIALGRVVATDKWGGYSTPFLAHIRWGGSSGWMGWVDEQGLAISSDFDAHVYVDHWIEVPLEKTPEPLAPDEAEQVIDDTVHCCPECERPSQFGGVCSECEREIGREAAEETFLVNQLGEGGWK